MGNRDPAQITGKPYPPPRPLPMSRSILFVPGMAARRMAAWPVWGHGGMAPWLIWPMTTRHMSHGAWGRGRRPQAVGA